MFTGIIQEIGTLKKVQAVSSGVNLEIHCPKLRPLIKIDDSVAVEGLCLTATSLSHDSFCAHAVSTTLQKTTLINWRVQKKVNLELALAVGERLGGHLVQGHVSGVAQIAQIESIGLHHLLQLKVPQELMHYFIAEASVAINGVSLTVSSLQPSSQQISVAIIPHSWESTTMQHLRPGEVVNIEVDVLAKYLYTFSQQKSSTSLQNLWREMNS